VIILFLCLILMFIYLKIKIIKLFIINFIWKTSFNIFDSIKITY